MTAQLSQASCRKVGSELQVVQSFGRLGGWLGFAQLVVRRFLRDKNVVDVAFAQ